jgi:hypothetical protein
MKSSKAAIVLTLVLVFAVPTYAAAPTPDSPRRGAGDDTVIARSVKTVKRLVKSILEQPAIPIPVVPPAAH